MALELPVGSERKKLRPYMCALCGESFIKAHSLQHHMTSIHGLKEEEGEEEEEQDVCSAMSSTGDHGRDGLLLGSDDCGPTSADLVSTNCLAVQCVAELRQLDIWSELPGISQVALSLDDPSANDKASGCPLPKSHSATEEERRFQSPRSQTLDATCISDIMQQAACAAKILEHTSSPVLPTARDSRSDSSATSGSGRLEQVISQQMPPSGDPFPAGGCSTIARLSPEQHRPGESTPVPHEESRSGEIGEQLAEGPWQVLHRSAGYRKRASGVHGNVDKKWKTEVGFLACRKEKRRTLEQKIHALKKANEETENYKYNFIDQQKRAEGKSPQPKSKGKKSAHCDGKKIASSVSKPKNTSERKGAEEDKHSGGEDGDSLPIQETTCTSTSKLRNLHVCREKFHSMDDCFEHLRDSHRVQSCSKLSGICSSIATSECPVEGVSSTKQNTTYICQVMDCTFNRKNEEEQKYELKELLNDDCNKSTGSSIFQCEFCPEVFESRGKLRIHAIHNCGKDNHKCRKCVAFIPKPSSKDLENISRAVEEARDLTDSDSYKPVKGKQLLVQYHQCIVCNDRFAIEKHLREHLNTHKTTDCQFCNISFPSTSELSRHIQVHNSGPLSCITCKQTFFSTYMLLLHMRGHTGNYRCQVCNASFMFRASLPRHMKLQHTIGEWSQASKIKEDVNVECSPSNTSKEWTQELKLKCHVCGRLYSTEATLQRHLAHCHPDHTVNTQQFICEVCGAMKFSLKQLKNHMICHREPRKECVECGKLFVRTASLKLHIKQVHREGCKFHCQYCGKSLTSQASLLNHERLHTGDKPYECPDCGKRFRICTSYKTHRAKEHTTELTFVCNKCPKRFAIRTQLTKHLRTHLPKAACPCRVCGKTFRREDLLKNHMATHRRRVRCHHCGRLFTNDFALRYHAKKIHNVDMYRTDVVQTDPMCSVLPSNHSRESSGITIEGFTGLPASSDGDSLSVNVVDSTSHVEADEDSLGVPVTTPAALHSSSLSFCPDTRLSDPTNQAITAILSDLCKRV